MNLQDLPNDILEKIYHIKHVAEYKDVLYDVVDVKKQQYEQCTALVTWLEATRLYVHDPNDEIEIWTALRNEGYITTVELITIIDDVYAHSDLSDFDLSQIDESDFHIKHSNITMKDILKKNRSMIIHAIEYVQQNNNHFKNNFTNIIATQYAYDDEWI